MSAQPPWSDPADLRQAIAERVNPTGRPSALVFNCHITGLAVARSLGARGVPVVGLDPDGGGYGLQSRHIAARGWCPNVLTDEAAFIAFLVDLAGQLEQPAVLFPTNDEWVMAGARPAPPPRGGRRFPIPFGGA